MDKGTVVTKEDDREIVVTLPSGARMGQISAAIDRLVRWIARHWLALFNTAVGIFLALPFLAPVLMHVGATGPGRLIYLLYSPTCHQLPERSFFFFGPRAVYSAGDLEQMGVLPAGLTIFQREALRFVGNASIGYKVAFCERDAAIYASILLAGLAFGVIRRRAGRGGKRLQKMSLWVYALLLLPMALDGGTQLVGLRESTWWLRLLTGLLFGVATVWLAYPYVHEAMEDVLRTMPPPKTGQTSALKV